MLVIPFYKDNCKVCAGEALVSYIKVSEPFRGEINNLFITLKKPFKAVTTQTLARWVTDTLTEAGLDTKIFSAHSTRHAATSTANKKGISLSVIKKTAGWTSQSSTFAKFYNKEIINDQAEFANAILES